MDRISKTCNVSQEQGATLATRSQHIWVAKTRLGCPDVLNFAQNEGTDVFGATCLDDKTHLMLRNVDTWLLLRIAKHYVTNRYRPK